MLVLLALLTPSISESPYLWLDCSYSIVSLWKLSDLYTCTGALKGNDRTLSGVSDNHWAGRYNSHVLNLAILDQSQTFIPFGIAAFFPNLESLDMRGVEEIAYEHLRGLSRLKQFHLRECNIKLVDGNVFNDNPNLIAISFLYNPVKHVAPNAFEGLTELRTLHFFGSACFGINIDDDYDAVQDLISDLFIHCPPTFNQLRLGVLSGLEFEQRFDEMLNPTLLQIHQIYSRLEELEDRVWRLEQPPTAPTTISDE